MREQGIPPPQRLGRQIVESGSAGDSSSRSLDRTPQIYVSREALGAPPGDDNTFTPDNAINFVLKSLLAGGKNNHGAKSWRRQEATIGSVGSSFSNFQPSTLDTVRIESDR